MSFKFIFCLKIIKCLLTNSNLIKKEKKLINFSCFSGNGSVPPTVLTVLTNEHLVKDEIALHFLVEVFVTFKQEKGLSSLTQTLKKGALENRLMEFFPINKRSEEYLKSFFVEKGLAEIVKLHKTQASQEAKRELQTLLLDDINDNKSTKEIIADLKEMALKYNIPEHEVINLIWTTIMSLGEWNKKEELVADQALKHLKSYSQLFQAFTTNARSELSLILKVQEFCYENMNFMKAFQKIMLLFYKSKFFSIIFYFYQRPQEGIYVIELVSIVQSLKLIFLVGKLAFFMKL